MGRAETVLDELFDSSFAWAGRKTAEDPDFFRPRAARQETR